MVTVQISVKPKGIPKTVHPTGAGNKSIPWHISCAPMKAVSHGIVRDRLAAATNDPTPPCPSPIKLQVHGDGIGTMGANPNPAKGVPVAPDKSMVIALPILGLPLTAMVMGDGHWLTVAS